MSETRLYFAYGSNINLDHMAHRCPKAEVIGPVTLDGYELTFRGRADGNGVGNIEPKEGASVPGVLWRITPDCEQALDRYEGVPRLYVQKDVTVRDSEGNSHTVMAYVMTDLFREHALPSPFYFQSIRDGYRQNGMGEDYQDFDLVIAQQNGRPYSEKDILKRLRKFCEEQGLPDVVVHSLRHTSVDLKLELSGGNIKAVQADAGHRTEKMVTERYSAMRERRRYALASAMDTMLTERKLPVQSSPTR